MRIFMLILSIAGGLWLAWSISRSDESPPGIAGAVEKGRPGVVAVAACGDTFASAVPRLNAIERDYGNVLALINGDPEACTKRLNLKMKTARATERHGTTELLYVLDAQGRVTWQGSLLSDTLTARRELARIAGPREGKQQP
jgi:hypothetical protein